MDVLPDDAPAPRLCHLIKWPDFDGYGFNLHAERSNPGQFIGKIDDESPAQMAGLREGDRIVEVNGVNINNENHRQVVERIKSDPHETRLLVVDADTDSWYKEQDIVLKSSQLNVIYIKTPEPRPQPDSPRAKFHHSSPVDSSSEQVAHSDSQQQQQVSLSPSTTNASSLATSDFVEDSIEQPALATPAKTRCSPAPMSPDSGKGEEEQHVVTIEAEINRQSPVGHSLLKSQVDEREQSVKTAAKREEAHAECKLKGSAVDQHVGDQETDELESNVEPDSLSQPGGSMSPSRPATASSQVSSSSSLDTLNLIHQASATFCRSAIRQLSRSNQIGWPI